MSRYKNKNENMISISNIKQIHKYLLEIAIEFHKICVANDIKYYMAYGTMLGAVRHRGFIPWDDDMDFYVYREDVPKIKEIMDRELPPHLKLIDFNNSQEVIYDMLKIEDTRTTMIQKHKQTTSFVSGIYIDIFILDYVDNNFTPLSHNWVLFYLKKIQSARFLDSFDRKIGGKIISYFVKVLFFLLELKTIPSYINRMSQNKRGCYLYNHTESKMGRCFLPEVFSPPILYDFEGIKLFGIKRYDEYLRKYYGDYMQLPPNEERQTHIIKVFLKNVE